MNRMFVGKTFNTKSMAGLPLQLTVVDHETAETFWVDRGWLVGTNTAGRRFIFQPA